MLILPLICSCLITIMFTDLRADMTIGYYSEEMYDSCEVNNTITTEGCKPSPPYTCQYIEILREKHLIDKFDSVEEGLQAIRHGKIYILIVFPYNFTRTVLQRITIAVFNENENVDDSLIEVWLDTTVYTAVFGARIDIYESLEKLIALKCEECGVSTRLSQNPISFQKPTYGQFNKISSQIIPRYANAFLFYVTYMYSASSLIMEKSSGVLERVQMSGVTTSELLTANYIVLFIVVNIQNILMLTGIHVVFKELYFGSLSLMYSILILSELCGSVVGLLVMTYSQSVALISYLGVVLILTQVFTDGMVWPPEAIHWFMKPLVQLVPVNMVTESYSHVMLRGFPLTHHLVYPGVIYLTLYIIAVSAIATYRIRKNNNQL